MFLRCSELRAVESPDIELMSRSGDDENILKIMHNILQLIICRTCGRHNNGFKVNMSSKSYWKAYCDLAILMPWHALCKRYARCVTQDCG